MTEKSFFRTDNIKRKILPLLFTAVMTSAILNVFLGNYFGLYSAVCVVLAAALFAVYDYIAAHKLLGPLIYMTLIGFFVILTGLILSTVPRGMWFTEWFLTGGGTVDTIPQYLLIVVISFTFFISSVVYYFTHIVYRVSILTLVSLIPCAIYVKAAQTVPAVFAVMLAAMNIFLYVYQNRNIFVSRCRGAGKAAEITSYIDFAAAAVLLAILIPKPAETPYYEKFEAFTSRFNLGGHKSGISGEYTAHSGNADDYNDMESKLLYLVSTDTPQYLKIQTFDIYEPENRYWVAENSSSRGRRNWQEKQAALDYSKLLNAYISSGSPLLESAAEQTVSRLSSDGERLINARIRAVDYPASFVLSPERITYVSFLERQEQFAYRSDSGETWPYDHYLTANAGYDVKYYDSDYCRSSGWVNSGLCDISYEEYGALLSGLSEESEAAAAFYYSWEKAGRYSPSNYAPVSDEIQKISDEITEGLTNDWEKAEAIEKYFRSGSFVYDLSYKAPEESDTPEFFLTKSRRGTCSDFTTAYCLLARAAGLRVRFAEGFGKGIPAGSGSGGLYQLYTEDAHSYPEVYIPGADWIIYEPTVSSNSTRNSGAGADDGGTDYLSMLVTAVAVMISAAAVAAVIILIPVLEEKLFELRIKFSPAGKGVINLYGRYIKQCGRLYGISSGTMTAEQISGFTLSKTGSSPDKLTLAFEKVCYGRMDISAAELSEALSCYKISLKLLKKAKRAKRRKKHEKR